MAGDAPIDWAESEQPEHESGSRTLSVDLSYSMSESLEFPMENKMERRMRSGFTRTRPEFCDLVM
jgi:hypothetical protein